MKARMFTPADRPALKAWWEARKQQPPALEMLSTSGIVVESDDGKRLAAGWLIMTNMETALFEWITRNPDLNKEEAGEALDFLINALKVTAKEQGYKLYITFIINKSLKKRFKDHGALAGDPNLQSFIGGL